MRLLTLPKLLLLGGAVALVLGKRRRSAAPGKPGPAAAIPDPDPSDVVQGFDDVQPMHLEELVVDARTTADYEVAHDLASLESTFDEGTIQIDGTPDVDTLGTPTSAGDGILYGTQRRAGEHSLSDGATSFDQGENWVEALQTSAIEDAEPELELEAIDDMDDLYDPPHSSDTRDIPVADLGSAGPRGL